MTSTATTPAGALTVVAELEALSDQAARVNSERATMADPSRVDTARLAELRGDLARAEIAAARTGDTVSPAIGREIVELERRAGERAARAAVLARALEQIREDRQTVIARRVRELADLALDTVPECDAAWLELMAALERFAGAVGRLRGRAALALSGVPASTVPAPNVTRWCGASSTARGRI